MQYTCCDVCSARESKENMDDLEIQHALVSWDGSCYWWTAIKHSSSHCRMNIAWFPLDTQRCTLTFESWTMNSQEMNMTAMDPAVDLNYYKESGEWDIIGECSRPSSNTSLYTLHYFFRTSL